MVAKTSLALIATAALAMSAANAEIAHVCSLGDWGQLVEEVFDVDAAPGTSVTYSGSRFGVDVSGTATVTVDGFVRIPFDAGSRDAQTFDATEVKVTIDGEDFTASIDADASQCLTIESDCLPLGVVTVSSKITDSLLFQSYFGNQPIPGDTADVEIAAGATETITPMYLSPIGYAGFFSKESNALTDYVCGGPACTGQPDDTEDCAGGTMTPFLERDGEVPSLTNLACYNSASAANAQAAESSAVSGYSTGTVAGVAVGGAALSVVSAAVAYKMGSRSQAFAKDLEHTQAANTV